MSSDNTVIEMDDESVRKSDGVIAKIPKEQLKSLFYLFAGKPDSRIKVFNKPIFIERDDIIELNDCITRKLKTHNIYTQITSLTVGFVGSDIHEYGTWEEFRSHHWQDPECIEELVIKWDFMVSLESYKMPQRHTLMVRISSDMKPGKFLQMIASGNSDDFDKVDVLTAPAFCRVDFINAQISKELINEVTDWFKGRKQPALIPSTYYFFKKKRQSIAEILHYSALLIYAVVWVSAFLWTATNIYEGEMPMQQIAIWLFVGITLLTLIHKVGHVFASRIYRALDEIEGSKVVFEFTSGDKKKNSELINKNNEQGRKFIKESVWTLVVGVAASLIATYLYLHS